MKLLYWSPRILSLLFVGFLSLFALDVFTGPVSIAMILGFLVHLLPSFALLVLAILAWRYPLVGAVAFIAFAFAYVLLAGFDRPWSWYAAISLPCLIIGTMYLADWLYHRKSPTV